METQDIKISFIEAFFGNHSSSGEYMAFIIFTLLSMLLFKLIRYQKKKKEGLITNFSPKIWISDNALDFVTAFMSAFLVFRFIPEAGNLIAQAMNMTPLSGKMVYGVVLGIGFQYIWHKILNKVKV